MGYRLVKLPAEVMTAILTKGNRYPNSLGQSLIITKGLPEGVKLEAVSGEVRFAYDEIVLKYSHPDWANKPGAEIPYCDVEYGLEYDSLPEKVEFCYKTGKLSTRAG